MLPCAGCLRIDGTILADGSALLRLDYLLRSGTMETERLKFASPDIEILAANLCARRTKKKREATSACVDLRVRNLDALSSAYMFRVATVTKLRAPPGGRNNLSGLTIEIQNDRDPRRNLQAVRFYFSKFTPPPVVIRLTFPGRVESSNANSTDQETATWRFPPQVFFGDPRVILTAWYEHPAGQESRRDPEAQNQRHRPSEAS